MSDNLQKRQPEDSKRINLTEAWELNYWCEKLNVTQAQLKAAVKATGPSVSAVRKHLASSQ
jgi:hypothetical protein